MIVKELKRLLEVIPDNTEIFINDCEFGKIPLIFVRNDNNLLEIVLESE